MWTLVPTLLVLSWEHDDVIKWKHFPRYWQFVRGIHRSTVNSPHKGQWRGALMFPLICAWINGSVNNSEAGDLRRHRTQYDVIVMRRPNLQRLWAGILAGTRRWCRKGRPCYIMTRVWWHLRGNFFGGFDTLGYNRKHWIAYHAHFGLGMTFVWSQLYRHVLLAPGRDISLILIFRIMKSGLNN